MTAIVSMIFIRGVSLKLFRRYFPAHHLWQGVL